MFGKTQELRLWVDVDMSSVHKAEVENMTASVWNNMAPEDSSYWTQQLQVGQEIPQTAGSKVGRIVLHPEEFNRDSFSLFTDWLLVMVLYLV